MASVRALSSARTWTFGGDLRSYLLCCFSVNQSSDRKSATKSETDVELAQYLDDVDAQIPSESVGGGIESQADGETEEDHFQARDVAEQSTDDLKTPKPFPAADESHLEQNYCTDQADNESRDAERIRFSSHDPSDLTKEASADSLPPIIDLNHRTHLQHDARREPLANGLRRPGSLQDSRPCNDNRRREEADDGDAADVYTNASEQTTLLTTTTAAGGDPADEIVNPESDDKLFDVSDLQEMSKCGRIHITLDYSFARKRLNVTVHEASEIPNQERGGSTNTQVRLALLPTKNSRHKTKIIRASENPKYDETFQFKLQKEDLNRSGLRLRLYGCERLSRERMIGECIVRFVNLNLEKPSSNWFTLEPRISFADSSDRSSLGRRSRSSSAASSSSQSVDMEGMEGMEGSSELLLSLAYNAITGRLTVDVLQGTNLKYLSTNRPPDTFVRVTLMSSGGKELTRSNTSVRKMSPNPVYREKFMFQVVETQLAEVSLMVSVYAKRSLKREELVGWFILGYNNSGEDELVHWNDMRASGGGEVERWHVLAEP